MHLKASTTNPQRSLPKTSSQNFTMRKRTTTKRRYSQQSKLLYTKQDSTLIVVEHFNTTTRFPCRSFQPLATSTPLSDTQYFQRPSPVFCSTPKQSRRPNPSSSVKRKLPIVISQRRLQFTTNSQSFVGYSGDEDDQNREMTIKNMKIWLV